MIASTKNGIDMKCLDSQKPLCAISLWFFLILLKMTLKYIVHMKARPSYNHKDPPFDIKHQLMSADPFPVFKLTWSRWVSFPYFFYDFCLQTWLFDNHYEKNWSENNENTKHFCILSILSHLTHFLAKKTDKRLF